MKTFRMMVTGLLAGCWLGLAWTQAAGAAEAVPHNRAPLKPQPYYRLPLGSVRAKNWLKRQLELQRDGLTGHAEELYGDIGQSDWISDTRRGGQNAWERGPYYAKGLIALAYVLDDAGLKAKAKKWIDRILASQRDDGDFGPKPKNWWPNMIVLHYLRDYYEVSGDGRILSFMEKYFQFQRKELPGHPLEKESGWAKARGGDNIEIVLWLYNLQGKPWLLDLAKTLMQQTNEWHKFYAKGEGNNWYPQHIVNVMQGLKTPPLMYLIAGGDAYRGAFAQATSSTGWLKTKYGRVDGMLNGTEPLTDRSTTQGTELCAIVERILATTVAVQVLGNADIGDQLEQIAYNALPADLAPDGKGLRYYILTNQPKCTNERLAFRHNGGKQRSICPGPNSGYACCRSNFHFGWPKFVANMWMATVDGGLAIAAYGPNTVTAKVGKAGQPVTIEQTTDYPFKEGVTLRIREAEGVAFPLDVRIPRWCDKATVAVNGKPQPAVKPGAFLRLERTWKTSDTVELRFPMGLTTSRWYHNSVAITRGPLVFSLLMEAESKTIGSFLKGRFSTNELRPKKPWNYALVLSAPDKIDAEETVAAIVPAQPFCAVDAPVRLKLKAVRTDEGGWGTFQKQVPARAVEPPTSPVKMTGKVEEIILVPYGSTEIRITCFPWTKS